MIAISLKEKGKESWYWVVRARTLAAIRLIKGGLFRYSSNW
jgi:hypothetical protein